MAAWGAQLLDWLHTHTFPAEQAFADRRTPTRPPASSSTSCWPTAPPARSCSAPCTRPRSSALFEAALARDMRLVAGKVLMDRSAPAGLTDTVESGRTDTEALIRAWRGAGGWAMPVTPRFAVTSSDAQLAMAGEIAAANPDVLVHTHMSENLDEIAEVGRLFPGARDYLDVYDRFGLAGPRSVFAHCVHSTDDALTRMAAKGASAAFCPSSNLLLGSGLFSLKQACGCGVNSALGTDVGGGGSFSLLHMMGEAYKVGQLRGDNLDPLQAFYLATLAGAKALRIDDHVGNLAPGKEADFVVLDLAATPLLARRTVAARSLAETLFILSVLADDRAVEATYLAGRKAHARDRA
jgi:guanine deaminase